MADNNNNDQVLFLLGQIKGELTGIKDLVQSSSETTNRRIDDLANAMNRRIDDHQSSTDARFESIQKQITKKGAAAGGGSGLVVAGIVEIIKHTLG